MSETTYAPEVDARLNALLRDLGQSIGRLYRCENVGAPEAIPLLERAFKLTEAACGFSSLARDVRVVEVSPKTRAKHATGDGNADKFEVLAAAIRRLGYDGHDHNAADALWLSAIGHALLGEPLVDLPAKHREALAAVRFDVSEVTV